MAIDEVRAKDLEYLALATELLQRARLAFALRRRGLPGDVDQHVV